MLDFGMISHRREETLALDTVIERARLAESLGFSRYWLGEHDGSGSAWESPTPVIESLAKATNRIRVGAAGVLLSRYDPLEVAHDYALLEQLAPGRVDLGLARASERREVAGDAGAVLAATNSRYAESVRILIENVVNRPGFSGDSVS